MRTINPNRRRTLRFALAIGGLALVIAACAPPTPAAQVVTLVAVDAGLPAAVVIEDRPALPRVERTCTVSFQRSECRPHQQNHFFTTTGTTGGHFKYECLTEDFQTEDVNCNPSSSIGISSRQATGACTPGRMRVTYTGCQDGLTCSTVFDLSPCP